MLGDVLIGLGVLLPALANDWGKDADAFLSGPHVAAKILPCPKFRNAGTYELDEMLSPVLKPTKELWGKASNSAKSWGKSDLDEAASKRKTFLATCDAAASVGEWSVNRAVHYNAWANFGVNDFRPS